MGIRRVIRLAAFAVGGLFLVADIARGEPDAQPRSPVVAALAVCVENPGDVERTGVARVLSENGVETIDIIIDVTFPGVLGAPDSRGIRRLVRDLGSVDFRDRDAATRQLVRMGRGVLPHVRPLLGSEDPEVRWRAEGICASLDEPLRPLLRDRARTLEAFHTAVWRGIPLGEMRAAVRARLSALERVDALPDGRERDILGVLLASLRYSADRDDRKALFRFARSASDAPASVAIRVLQGGVLHALDTRSADRWGSLPEWARVDMVGLMDPERPESYRSVLACAASADVLAKARRDAGGRALAGDRELLRDVNAHLLQECGDDAARRFFLARVEVPEQAEDALIQLFARDGPAAGDPTDARRVRDDRQLDALWARLFMPADRAADGQTGACLYVWAGPVPAEQPWSARLTLARPDRETGDDEKKAEWTRLVKCFRVERFGGLTPGRYELKLDDGATCLRRGVFLTPGVNVALLPPVRIVGEGTHLPLPSGDTVRQEWRYTLGAMTNSLYASLRLEERDGLFSVSGPRAIDGRLCFDRLPVATYKVHLSIDTPQLRVKTEPSVFLLQLPPAQAGVLHFPFRYVAGMLSPAAPTGGIPVFVSFRTQLAVDGGGTVAAVWNAASNSWRDAHVSIGVPMGGDGTFSAPLLPAGWLGTCDASTRVTEEAVTVREGSGPVTLRAMSRGDCRLEVKVRDAEDGRPLDAGDVVSVMPVAYVHEYCGYAMAQPVRGGGALLGQRQAAKGYSLYVRAPGYVNSMPSFFDLERDTVIDVALRKGGVTLTVRIVNDRTGERALDVSTIGLYYKAPANCMWIDNCELDRTAGCFRASGLRAGRYEIQVTGYDVVSGQEFELSEEETAREIDLHVRPPK